MNEIISLITIIPEADATTGMQRLVEQPPVEFFANPVQGGYQDWYGSQAEEVRPMIAFELSWDDFLTSRRTEGGRHYWPEIVLWDGARYKVTRWRQKNAETAVIYCG